MRLTSHTFSSLPGIVTAAVVAALFSSACSGSSDSSGPPGSGGADNAGDTGVTTGGTVSAAGGAGAAGAQPTGGVKAAGGNTTTSTTPAAGGTSGGTAPTGGAKAVGGASNVNSTGGAPSAGGTASVGGSSTGNTGGTKAAGGVTSTGGAPNTGGSKTAGGASGIGGSPSTGGSKTAGGASSTGGSPSTGGSKATGGSPSTGGSKATGGATSAGGCASGPIGTFTGALATGITFMDTDGKAVNAHGGGIIKVGSTYYMHGEYFLSTTTDNNFNGFSMYSSQDMATWKNEGIILPQQASGQLGPNRKGERPHIIKCPSTGEFVLYAHSADTTYQVDKEVVYATSATVNGQYSFKGSLTNAGGTIAAHSDMSALTDGNNAYVVTESGHVYTLAADCHSWLSDTTVAVNGDSGGSEAPTVFKAGSTFYWIGSYKTGWRANNNFYSTASSMTGTWTYQGFIAPVTDTSTTTPAGDPNPPEQISDQRTWLSQTTWVQPVVGCQGTTYVFWGDHWYGDTDTTNPGKHNDQATYVFQPLVFNGTKISMPTYHSPWSLDVGLGTWQ